MQLLKSDYYVYEHWRPDKNVCFYVGKGRRDRAYLFYKSGRSAQHRAMARTLVGMGLAVDVRIVASGLTDEEAKRQEVALIAYWREAGVSLFNLTDGGDGRPGCKLSDETRRRISDSQRGKPKSAEHRLKMSLAHTGKILSEATKAALSRAHMGRKKSPEAIEKTRQANLGRKQTPEQIARHAAALRGRTRGPLSSEVKAKISAKARMQRPTAEQRAKMCVAQQARQRRARMLRSADQGVLPLVTIEV